MGVTKSEWRWSPIDRGGVHAEVRLETTERIEACLLSSFVFFDEFLFFVYVGVCVFV